MDISVLNTSIELDGIIDEYDSCIWTDRYDEAGDFELILPVSKDILNILKIDNYLTQTNSEHIMMIEKLELKIGDSGYNLVASGESLESILKRRIIYSRDSSFYTFSNGTNIAIIIKKLLDGTCSNILPENDPRRIEKLYVGDLHISESFNISEDVNYLGNNLYDTISELCKAFNVGFKIILENGNFRFVLYSGLDRSYSQSERPFVVFSNRYGNVISANYLENKKEYKNTAYIRGKENEQGLAPIEIYQNGDYGLNRREIFVDAGDTDDGYLLGKGQEELQKCVVIQEFDGEVDPNYNYTFRIDYDIGDIVQYEIITDEIEVYPKARIKEIIYSHDQSGYIVYPTFKVITEEG